MLRFAPLLLALAATPAAATPFQNTAALDHAVAAFTGHPVGEEGGARTPVDARLKLAACPFVALSWHGDRHDAVVVACGGPNWKVYVPVIGAVAAPTAAGAPALAAAPAVKAAVVIHRGDPVTIEADSDGFSIARDGVAMADAAAGARLMVKVDDAPRPVQAVAVDTGRATLPGWSE